MVWPASLLRFADTKNPSAASPCAATTIRSARTPRPLVVHAVREISRSLYPESDHSRRPRKAPSVPAATFSAEMMDRLLAASPEDWI